MSSEQSSASKTEDPTPKRLEDAREKGQVSKSKEVVSVAVIILVMLYFYIFRDFYFEHIRNLVVAPFDMMNIDFMIALRTVTKTIVEEAIILIIPLFAIVTIIVLLFHFIQFGFIFSLEPIKPDLKKINPVEIAKKQIFSKKALIELLKSILKVILLSIIVIFVVRKNIQNLLKIPYCDVACIGPILIEMVKELILFAMIGFIIIAIFDFFFEKHQHKKQLMMTKDEVKREYKDLEGNPEIKGKRKQLYHELVNSGVQDSVQQSNVVVTNPTHLAVAIKYKKDETPLPIVQCKGERLQAKKIVHYAKMHNIPVLQKISLARALFYECEEFQYIPKHLIVPVAEVIKWCEKVSKKDGSHSENEND